MAANNYQIAGDHYRRGNIQPWDAIADWELGFLDGNVVKYMARWKKKEGLKDLMKAKHYLEKLIEEETARVQIPTLTEKV